MIEAAAKKALVRFCEYQRLRRGLFEGVRLDGTIAAADQAFGLAFDACTARCAALGIEIRPRDMARIGRDLITKLQAISAIVRTVNRLWGPDAAVATLKKMTGELAIECGAPPKVEPIHVEAVRILPSLPMIVLRIDSDRDLIRQRPLSQAGPP